MGLVSEKTRTKAGGGGKRAREEEEERLKQRFSLLSVIQDLHRRYEEVEEQCLARTKQAAHIHVMEFCLIAGPCFAEKRPNTWCGAQVCLLLRLPESEYWL